MARNLSVAVVLSTLLSCVAAITAERPNVIIFIVDDVGFGDIKALNPQGGIPTPVLDGLVANGLSFVNAHSSASVCAPTRYALLTGNRVYRGRNAMGTWAPFGGSQILKGQTTIADMLQKHGYATAFFGKLHLGGVRAKGGAYGQFRDGPVDHGFDYSLTLPSGIQASPFAFFRNDRLSRWDDDKKDFVHFSSKAEADRFFKDQKMDNWSTETVGPLLMHDALDFIDKHHAQHKGEKPFFIHYCSQAGHTPYVPPAHFNAGDPMDTSKGIPIKGRTTNPRTDMVHEADVAVGLFQKQLSKHGLWKNTLFIFTSDNGVAKGVNSTWSNPVYQDGKDGKYGGTRTEKALIRGARDHVNGQGVVNGVPIRGKKGYCYEGGHRVPLIMHWPARISTRRETQLIALHDIYRTLAGLLTVSVPKTQAVDSVDFSDLVLSGSGKLKRKKLLIQANRPTNSSSKRLNSWSFYWAAKQDGKMVIWKSIINNNRNTPQKATGASVTELYNLTADPGESNVLKDPKRSQKMLEDYRKSL
ncbi:MAG: sulfatase-like hydrolase/transferase [Planctomycetota bacterium]|jgi:arylsulfatase A-like enzyme